MGGTGSGTCQLLLDRLNVDYGKMNFLKVKVVPPPNMLGNEIVALYNNHLALADNNNMPGINLWFDNDSLYKICQEKLGNPSADHADINRLIVE